MLRIIDSLASVDFRQLMDVYAEGNRLNGQKFYPDLSGNLQILYAEQDFYVYLEEFFVDASSRYAVWLVDGRYVAALRLERYNDGLLLNALETAPTHRGNGYAKQLIQSLLEYLRCTGNGVLYSHVAKSNISSLNVHYACGFHIHAEQAIYLDGSVRPDSYTLLLNY